MGESGSRRRILLVDDEKDVRLTVRMLLEIELKDVEVVESPSGDDAIERFVESHFDLVISDYKMPGMDGLELLGHLRSKRPQVPRVMITASPDAALDASDVADALFRKPFDVEPFMHEIRGLITTPRVPSNPLSSPSWPAV